MLGSVLGSCLTDGKKDEMEGLMAVVRVFEFRMSKRVRWDGYHRGGCSKMKRRGQCL